MPRKKNKIAPLLPDGIHEVMGVGGGGRDEESSRACSNRSLILLIYPLYQKSGSHCERDEARQKKDKWQMDENGWKKRSCERVSEGNEFYRIDLKNPPAPFRWRIPP